MLRKEHWAKKGDKKCQEGWLNFYITVAREGWQPITFDFGRNYSCGFLEIGYASECLSQLVFSLEYISFWILVFCERTGEVTIYSLQFYNLHQYIKSLNRGPNFLISLTHLYILDIMVKIQDIGFRSKEKRVQPARLREKE